LFTAVNVGSGIPTSNRRLLETLRAGRELHVSVGEEVRSYSCADITLGNSLFGEGFAKGIDHE
jgi:hypothetical protein